MMSLSFTVLSFLLACTDGTDGDPIDTALTDTDSGATDSDTDVVEAPCYEGTEAGSPEFTFCEFENGYQDAITLDCAAKTMTLNLRTIHWGYKAEFFMANTRFDSSGVYDELHTLTDNSSADSSGWSLFERTLATDTAFADVTEDESTLFKCDGGNGSGSAFKPTEDGGNHDVTFAAVVYEDDQTTIADCIVFGQDPADLLDGWSGNPPSWLNSTNCRNAN